MQEPNGGTATDTEPAKKPDALVGDPNDRIQEQHSPTGSGTDDAEKGEYRFADSSDLQDHVDADPTWTVLDAVMAERRRQRSRYSAAHDDANTDFDWATRRQSYELELAGYVAEPDSPQTLKALIDLAALCVAQLEAIGRRRRQIRQSIENAENAGDVVEFRDVVTHVADRDGFRVTREFVDASLRPIPIFVRTRDLPVTREELAHMDEETWRKVVRDAATPSLDKLTERQASEQL